jgi:hypothetical protein
MDVPEEIVVSRVEHDGIVVTCDPPARFVPEVVDEAFTPWWEPPYWSVAPNEFLLTPRADSLDDLPRACESALYNLAIVLDDRPDERARARGMPLDPLFIRAAALRERLRVSWPAGSAQG